MCAAHQKLGLRVELREVDVAKVGRVAAGAAEDGGAEAAHHRVRVHEPVLDQLRRAPKCRRAVPRGERPAAAAAARPRLLLPLARAALRGCCVGSRWLCWLPRVLSPLPGGVGLVRAAHLWISASGKLFVLA